nr:hypothetical protein [Tanacetum cinerariifolium]
YQNEVNELRSERIARTANPLALDAQQQPVYHPQNHPTHYNQNSSTRSQQATTRNRGKVIVNSPLPIYDEEPSMVAKDDEMSKDKEIDKLIALISLSFKKIYKPTNNNLRTSSNTSRANQDNSLRINRGVGYDNQRLGHVVGARETVGTTVVQKSGIQCYNCKEFGHVARECQKPKWVKDAAYHKEKMLLYKQEEVGIQLNAEQADWRDDTDDDESEDQELEAHYIEHPEQSESIHDTYPIEQDEHNVIIDSLDMSYDREQIDQNDDDDNDLANERELLASLIEKLKCEIDDSKNRNKFLETSNKVLVEKLKGEIEDFRNKNISLESSNNRFKEAKNKLSETNKLLYNDFKKSQAELDRRNDVEYASKVEIYCAKAKGDLISYKMESQKSFNKYTQQINDLNQTNDLANEQRSRMSHTHVNNGISKESFNKQTTVLEKRMDESIPWDQKCKSSKELFKIKRSVGMIFDGVERCKETIAKRTYFGHIVPFIQNTIEANFCLEIRKINTDLEKFHMCLKEEMVVDMRYFNSLEIEVDSLRNQLETQKTQFLNEIDRLSREYYYADHMNEILGVYTELDEDKGIVISELKKLIEKLKGKSMETKFEKSLVIRQPKAFKSQRPSILGKLTIFLNSLERKDFSKSKSVTKDNVSNDFSKPATAQILPPNKKSILKNTNVLAPGMYKLHTEPTQTRTSQLPKDSRKTNKCMSFFTGVIPTTSVSRPQLKSNPIEDRVMLINSKGKKQEVEDQRRNVKLSKNKTFVTACNNSLKAKTSNVYFVCPTCGKCMLNEKQDMCVLKSVAKPFKKTVASESNQKPRNITRKLYDRVSKVCSWWYPKFTPPGYKWKPKSGKENLIEIVLFIVDFGCSKHMMGNLKLLINFVEKFLGTVKFGNDKIVPILGYGDLVQGAVTIKQGNDLLTDHVSFDLVPQCQRMALEHDSLSLDTQYQENVTQADRTVTTSNELDLLFSPMFAELVNGSSQVVSKSFAVTNVDAPNQRQQQHITPLNNQTTPDPTCQVPT